MPGDGRHQVPSISVAPNPFTVETNIKLTHWPTEVEQVTLSIYDVTGRRIRLFPIAHHTGSITWDGLTVSGSPVAAGTYFVSLEAGEVVETRRVVLLR